MNPADCPECGGTGFTLTMEPCDHGVVHGFVTSADGVEHAVAFVEHGAVAVEVTEPKKMATPKQMAFLARLCAERGMPEPEPMGARAASAVIDKLLATPKTVELPRSNRFAGTCADCGVTVEAEMGRAERSASGKWLVRHLDGACPSGDEKAALDADRVTEPGIYRRAGKFYRVKAGRYDKTAFWAECIVITEPDDPHAGHFAKPIVFVKRGRATFLRASDKITLAEAKEFGVAVGACINCGLHLDGEDGKSLTAGYGAKCAKKLGWRYPTTAEMKLIESGAVTWDELLAEVI